MDRYVHHFMDYMGSGSFAKGGITSAGESENANSNWSKMEDISLKYALFDSMYDFSGVYYNGKKLGVDVAFSDRGCRVPMDEVPLSDFFVMKQHPKGKHAELIVDQVNFWM